MGTVVTAAYSEDKGCRNTMEDVCVLQLDALPQGVGHPPNCRCVRSSHVKYGCIAITVACGA